MQVDIFKIIIRHRYRAVLHDVSRMDVPFVRGKNKNPDKHWSNILIAGELKENPMADLRKVCLDLGRYAREIFGSHDTRGLCVMF